MSSQHRVVVGRIHHHSHRLVVFGRAADHRGPADVDLLDRFGEGDVLPRDCRLKGIKIYHHQIDGDNAVLVRLLFVLLVAANIEQATMNLRMQCLDASARGFRANR